MKSEIRIARLMVGRHDDAGEKNGGIDWRELPVVSGRGAIPLTEPHAICASIIGGGAVEEEELEGLGLTFNICLLSKPESDHYCKYLPSALVVHSSCCPLCCRSNSLSQSWLRGFRSPKTRPFRWQISPLESSRRPISPRVSQRLRLATMP